VPLGVLSMQGHDVSSNRRAATASVAVYKATDAMGLPLGNACRTDRQKETSKKDLRERAEGSK